MSDKSHPFYPFDAGYYDDQPFMSVSVEDRCRNVKSFSLAQCQAALKNKKLALQKTVVNRINRRIRQLEKENR